MTERVSRETQAAGSGLRLGRVFGIELVAHWSLAVIFALITISLGAGVFPSWHPDWNAGLIWLISLLSAVLFFASIATHELAHALVGRWQGVPVERITLFIFGGMAHTTRQPPSAKAELLMAAVGPLTSLVIGLAATITGSWLVFGAAAQGADGVIQDPLALLAAAGPAATLLLWLGPINILLAIFNMIPGFPLDGGRVLRALLWWSTGNLERATRYAATLGQVFAWVLIGSGILMMFGFHIPVLGTGIGPGLWLVLIGWFLNNAARMSYEQVLIRDALDDVPVRAVMRSRLHTVAPSITIESLISEYFMSHDQKAFPVVDEAGDLVGLVCLDDVRGMPREKWPYAMVAEVMTPVQKLETMQPQTPALDALQSLSEHDIDQIPVLEGHHLVGMVRRRDIMKWLSLHVAARDA